MDRQIIIEGDFKVRGLTSKNNLSQHLKYLRLKIGYHPPPVEVEELRSHEGKNKEVTKDVKLECKDPTNPDCNCELCHQVKAEELKNTEVEGDDLK